MLVAKITVLLAALGACSGGGGGARVADAVSVPRCCGRGLALPAEQLAREVLAPATVAALCRPANDTPWEPLVYAPGRGRFLDRGRLPQHWSIQYAAPPSCVLARVLSDHGAPYALLANTGFLQVRTPTVSVPQNQYCTESGAALVCADAINPTADFVSKCCGKGRVYENKRCVENVELSKTAYEELVGLGNGSVEVGAGWPACSAGQQYAVAGVVRTAGLHAGGALQLAGDARRLGAGEWCGEAVVGERGTQVYTCEQVAKAVGSRRPLRHVLYGAGLAVGALFLAATLAASFALPAAHHALHWRCQTHYVAALMLGDVLLAATQLANDSVPSTLCRALAVCMHFLFLSAFFWLNTMCFNIWWTFRDFRPTSLERTQEAWRLRVYMVYAWGGPLALAGAAAVLDALPPSPAAADRFLRPRFAVQSCWFYGDMEILVYFFGPVGVLLLVNLALFISTTRQLTCGLWRRDEVKSTSERAALGRVCAKLVVVMGVTWGVDVVSWASGGPEYLWYATDLLNALQGVLIFIVVGCQRHAWAALKRCVGACWQVRESRNTHSSTHLPSCGESLTHTTHAPAPPTSQTTVPRVPMETVC